MKTIAAVAIVVLLTGCAPVNLDSIMGRGAFILGAEVDEFEKAFSKFCGAARALVLGNPARFIAWLCACTQRLSSTLSCASVRRYQPGEGGLLADHALVSGRDPNVIMQNVQGAALRPAWVASRLQEIALAIDEGRDDAANAGINHLAELWGSDDPELVRLSAWLG